MMCDIYVVAGEPSGDLQGAHLCEPLIPSFQIRGVAGPRLRKLGISGSVPMEELQVMGFLDVISALPRLWKIFRKVRSEIIALKPKAVICIDYPGFNLRLERSLRRHGYQGLIIHYISPTVWAWGKGRIPLMEKNLDLLLTIFPFEKACFSKTNLAVEYVGHPLVQKTAQHHPMENFKKAYGLDPAKKILALFPGSRETEIKRNLPLQLDAARRLSKIHDLQIAVSLAHEEHAPLFQGAPVLIDPAHSYDLMQNAHLAFATSGTVTLELALFQVPTVVNFAIRPLDVFLAQKIFCIDLPHYCIVNIIGGKTIFPELFGPNLTKESFLLEAEKLWEAREKCKSGCQDVRKLLGDYDAAHKAAQLIKDKLSSFV